MLAPRCDLTPAWSALTAHFEQAGRGLDLRQAFAQDPGRAEALTLAAPEIRADLSKNLWDGNTRQLLGQLARDCRLEPRRAAMLAGEPVNTTEGRAVLHTALRAPQGAAPFSDEVHEVLDRMLTFVEAVRAGVGEPGGIRHIVNIGIGGSDLGPQMVVPALDAWVHPQLQCHFVSNVDGHDIVPVLRRLDARRTLFIVASKTFTTQETMANAEVARAWFWPATARARRPRSAATSWPPPPTSRPQRASASHDVRLLGLGGRALLAVERHRPADRAGGGRRGLPRAAGRRACDGPALRRGTAGGQPAGAAGPAGRLVPQLPRLHQPLGGALPPGAAAAAGLPAAAGDGVQRQVRRPGRGSHCPAAPARWSGARPAPTASMPTSRCCTRART
jgi:hypothetical protein